MHEGKDGRPASAVKLQAFCFVEIFLFLVGGEGEREMCALVSWCDSCAKPFGFFKKNISNPATQFSSHSGMFLGLAVKLCSFI